MAEQKSDFHGGFVVSASVNPASLAAGAVANTAITIAGILSTDLVVAIPPVDLEAGLVPQGVNVSAADTLQVRLYNPTAGAVDGAAKTWQFLVFRR